MKISFKATLDDTLFSGSDGRSSAGGSLFRIIAIVTMVINLSGAVLAAPPIGGNPISVQGPTQIPAASQGVVRAVVAADLDTNGYADIAFGQADQLRIKANVGVTTTQWAQTTTVGSATYAIRDVHAVDLDRDGATDLVSASADDAGNSQLRLWQNPTLPFDNAWPISNTLVTFAISLTSIASADLDRNGTPDLVSGGLDGLLRLWSNPLTDTQAFITSWPSPATISTPGDQVRQVLVADVDRDGLPDIIEGAGDGASGTVRLWRNPGGAFTSTWGISHTLGTLTATVSSISVGDLDGDGAPDVLAALESGEVIAWRNPLTGTQPFTTGWGTSVALGNLGLSIVGLVVVDADHDGRLDVVATGSGTPSVVTAWRNTGQPFSGGWSQVTLGNPEHASFDLTAADFNRDGDDDFVTATGDTGTNGGGLQFWTNALIRSSVRFQTPGVSNSTADVLSGIGLHAMDVHDINRDGRPDIVVATLGGSLMILQNNGSPFASNWPTSTIGSSSGFFSVAAGDLDGDGWPDITTSTTLTDTGGLVQIWQNDGTPFAGTWTSQAIGAFPRQVTDLALGDVGREGHLQIVASTGITTTFDDQAERNVPTSDDNRIWLLRPSAESPFASAWISSTVCTTTYSANSVSLGDLDRDGWLDVVFGMDHAPPAGSDPDNWPNAYQVRACHNLGDPYSSTGWQTYDVGRDDAPISVGLGHEFWGAHVWSVAIGDLDHDGYPDAVSGGGAEGDYQVLVYKNSGTPFDGSTWEPTAVGYGSRTDGGPASCPPGGTYPEDCPWLEQGITAVNVGDLNADGRLDLVSGFGGSTTELPVWINTGTPFGDTVTDTHWIRYDLDTGASRPVYNVEVADLDSDGRRDVAAVTSWYSQYTPASGPLRVWRNLGGIARHTFEVDYDNDTIENGDSEAPITFAVENNGQPYDHGLELDYLTVRLVDPGAMNNTRASNLFLSLQVYRDANGDSIWQPTDSPVVTVTTFSLNDGWQTLDFPTGDPLAAISAGETVTYFVVLDMQPTASQDHPGNFRLYYTPHERLLVRDRDNQASVSLEEGAWTYTPWISPVSAPAASVEMTAYPTSIWADGASTSTITATTTTVHDYPVLDGTVITFTTSAGSLPSSPYTTTTTDGIATAVLTSSTDLTTAIVTGTVSITATDTVTVEFVAGPRASLRINDALGPGGNEVTTHTLTADDTFTVYAAAYDGLARFMDNPTDVTWDGAGVASGHLSPTAGVSGTTFAPTLVGTGAITVTDGSVPADATGTITVTPGALASFTVTSPSPQMAGQPFTVTVMAYDADNNAKTGYTGTVSFVASDVQAVLPTDDGSGWSNGGKDFVLEFRTSGVQTFTVQRGAVSQESADITVNPGPLGSFTVTAPGPQRAGLPFSITVTAYDSFSNIKTDYTGVVTFTSSDAQAVLPTDNGTGWSDGAKDLTLEFRTLGEQTYTAHDGTVSQESDSITVNPGLPASFGVTSPTPQRAGVPFTITVTAYDEYSNLQTDYVGPVIFTSSDPQAVLPTDDGTGWSNGVKDFALEFRTTGVQTYTARDTSVSQESAGITVNPGPLGSFTVSAPSPQQAGTPFNVTVTAYDIVGSLKTDYMGVVTFTSSDAQAVLPTDDGTGWSGGAKGFMLELRTAGVQTTSVRDGDVVQSSTGITVTPGALALLVIKDAAGGSGNEVVTHTMTTDDSFAVYAAGYDAYTNYISDIVVTWSTTGDLDPIPAGPATSATFTPSTAGTSGTITADDGNRHTAATGTITVTSPLDQQLFLPFVCR